MRKKVAKLLSKLTTNRTEYRGFKKFWNNTPRPEREQLKIRFQKQLEITNEEN